MTSPPRGGKPSHDNPGGHAYLGLRALAKRHGRTSAEYLRLYALEGFLLRPESSRHREDLILKGGASRCTEMFRLVSRSRRLLNMAVMRHSPCYAAATVALRRLSPGIGSSLSSDRTSAQAAAARHERAAVVQCL